MWRGTNGTGIDGKCEEEVEQVNGGVILTAALRTEGMAAWVVLLAEHGTETTEWSGSGNKDAGSSWELIANVISIRMAFHFRSSEVLCCASKGISWRQLRGSSDEGSVNGTDLGTGCWVGDWVTTDDRGVVQPK